MEKQLIISIGREFGSGGHLIGEKIAKDLGIHFYDRNLLDEIARERGMDPLALQKYDERPRNRILSRTVNGHTNSMEHIVAEMQFEYIKKKADSGESFVVVGRCSESILRGMDGLITIFVTGDRDVKLERVKEKFGLNDEEARAKMLRHDRTRKYYHNRYASTKWGDSRFYDICINSSKLGCDKTAELLEEYIRAYMAVR